MCQDVGLRHPTLHFYIGRQIAKSFVLELPENSLLQTTKDIQEYFQFFGREIGTA